MTIRPEDLPDELVEKAAAWANAHDEFDYTRAAIAAFLNGAIETEQAKIGICRIDDDGWLAVDDSEKPKGYDAFDVLILRLPEGGK